MIRRFPLAPRFFSSRRAKRYALSSLAAVLALALLVAPGAQAQSAADPSASDATPLSLNKEVTDSLQAGGQKAFAIDLDAGQFVAGIADQTSVDVVINVKAPDGLRE